jgi:hypothetical protein
MMTKPLDGLHIFPCKWDKTPAVTNGFYDATNDPAVIAIWRRRWFLFGAPTGVVNGFDVLDIDPGGQDWLATYEATHGLPLTRIHATRRGGLHYFFQHRPGLKKSESVIAPNVDIRAEGAYCILWHLAGCRVLCNAPIAPWPGPMLQLLYEAMEAKGHSEPNPKSQINRASPVVFNQRSDRLVPKPLYDKIIEIMRGWPGLDQRRVRGILRPLVEARDARNWALYEAALQMRELVEAEIIVREDAEELLFLSAELNGYIQLRGEDFARRTIKSGFEAKDRTTSEAQKNMDEE